MKITTLETSHLILHTHTLEDFPAHVAMRADPKVMRHMAAGKTEAEDAAWNSFLRFPAHWQYMGFVTWAIEEEESGHFIGDVGFAERKRDRGPELKGIPEMGWSRVSDAFGKGYATEAVRAALAWGREKLGPVRVIALTSEDNIASMRVAEKCGFEEFKRDLSAGRPVRVFDRIL